MSVKKTLLSQNKTGHGRIFREDATSDVIVSVFEMALKWLCLMHVWKVSDFSCFFSLSSICDFFLCFKSFFLCYFFCVFFLYFVSTLLFKIMQNYGKFQDGINHFFFFFLFNFSGERKRHHHHHHHNNNKNKNGSEYREQSGSRNRHNYWHHRMVITINLDE